MATGSELESIQNQMKSHCLKGGWFDNVITENLNGGLDDGITAQIKFGPLAGDVKTSSLASTDAELTLLVRLWFNASLEPDESLDLKAMQIAWNLIGSLHGDITFNLEKQDANGDGEVIAINIFDGRNFGAVPGYVETQGGTVFSIVDVTVPMTIENAWTQERS